MFTQMMAYDHQHYFVEFKVCETKWSWIFHIWAIEGNFEVVLKLSKCVWSPAAPVALIYNGTSNTRKKCIHDKFEAEGMRQDVHRQQSRMPQCQSSLNLGCCNNSHDHQKNPQDNSWETELRSNVHYTSKRARWEVTFQGCYMLWMNMILIKACSVLKGFNERHLMM
jgi:hypothetical protein